MKKIVFQNLKVAFFFFAIQFIVGTLFLYKNFSLDTLSWTAIISATTTLVFTVFMALYQFVYIRTNKISLADFDINPKQSATFMVETNIDQTKDIIENLLPNKLNSHKFKYDIENGIFKTKTGVTIHSWGEIIAIKLTEIDNAKTQLSVFSRPVLKTTLIDYGKSSMNIQKIKLAFNKNGL
jgi:hypothetical protein